MQVPLDFIKTHQDLPTPYLVVDLQRVVNNYKAIASLLPNVEVFYAMKANNHPKICDALKSAGASFEVASQNELLALLAQGVQPEKIFCFNPIKSPNFLRLMHQNKVEVMAIDSFEEVDKISKYAPDSKVVVRINVPDEGSLFPLGGKFGIDPHEAAQLIQYAKKKGVEPYGITLHVGSQCTDSKSWGVALEICHNLYNQLKNKGVTLSLISLGGGLPAEYVTPVPTVSEIAKEIEDKVQKLFVGEKGLRFSIEPGRGVVAGAGVMVSTVIGKSTKKGKPWIYLDIGVFNGVMEILGGFRFKLITDKKGEPIISAVAGPSCDSYDVLSEEAKLPPVEVGDKVYIMNHGAYSTVFASEFNGFEIPKTYFLNEK